MYQVTIRYFSVLFFCCFLDSIVGVSILQTPNNLTVIAGDDATFSCQFVELVNEQIVWFYTDSNEILTRDNVLETTDPDKQARYTIKTDNNEWFNLTIHNVTFTDEGEYECGYSGNRGDGRDIMLLARAFLDVVTEPDLPVCTVSYPLVLGFPAVGDYVSINCSAPGGDPKPDIKWFEDDILKYVGTKMDRFNVELTLDEDSERGATFRCDVVSPVLPLVESCSIIPFPRLPTIAIIPNGSVEFGNDASFQCKVSGDLSLSIVSFVTSLAINRFTLNSVGNIMTILNFSEGDLKETITCKVSYDEFDDKFTSTIEFEEVLPDLEDEGNNENDPNQEDTPTLTIILVVLGVIILILVCISLVWYYRKKIMS